MTSISVWAPLKNTAAKSVFVCQVRWGCITWSGVYALFFFFFYRTPASIISLCLGSSSFFLLLLMLIWDGLTFSHNPYPHSHSRHTLHKVNPVLQSSNYSITVKIIVLFFFLMVKFYVKKSVLNILRFLSSNNGCSINLFNGVNCMWFLKGAISSITISILCMGVVVL